MTTPSGPVRRVLVVGSWAKEQITVEHLKATSDAEVHAFIEVANPGIMELADGYEIGDASDVDAVVGYAADRECDLVLVTTAAPLQASLGDALAEAGVGAFAPTREAARLEWDKAFTRELLSEVCPGALPRFRVCDSPERARAFAEELEWSVAVKPLGLTEGLGVQVAGDQLDGPDEVRDYIDEVCAESIGGSSRVLIEERLVGEEFTIQTLVSGDRMVATPAVQDFKKLLAGDRGPNTASMGSYADAGALLPFLDVRDHRRALEIMQRTLTATASRHGDGCRGFLYGQFMITASGIKLIEYNFRPGDPEWMNTISVLATPLLDSVMALMNDRPVHLRSRPEASVVQYIVPPEYPERLYERLDVELDVEGIRGLGVHTYYSAGLDDDGRLDVGSERGIAFLATAPTVPGAHERVEEAIATVQGEFRHRSDIGTARQLRAKAHSVADLAPPRERIRRAREEDAEAVHRLAGNTPPLESYPQHQYIILLRYFGDCSFVAVVDGEVAAFEMGFPAADPETYFLWQIGVASDFQGRGLGTRLLDHVEREVAARGCRRIEVTVDPDNEPSLRLFEAAGYRNISRREGETEEIDGRPAVLDYYGPDSPFVLFEKRLDGDG